MFIQKAFLALVGAAAAVHALPGNLVRADVTSDQAGLYRFEQVTKHIASGDVLYRSSAPNYRYSDDATQNVTAETVAFFQQKGITHVISLNHHANDPIITAALKDAGIAYTPLQVADFTAPTIDDFKKGFQSFTQHRRATLVWCGFGHGRTGTMVSALQIQAQAERGEVSAMTAQDYDDNNVETPKQREVLNKLQKEVNDKIAAASPTSTAAAAPTASAPPAKPLGPKEMENQLCSTAGGKQNKYEMEESDCRIQVAQCVFEVTKTNPKAGWDSILSCMDSKFLPVVKGASAPIWA
ncbi:hypothetical protein ISF_03830 [Cordyceps fumosorosea ARSEF 2679]|uniref:Swiss Army Knife protein DSP-PTPase phosphatase domain-containing protein n=1 Tax=Cordyceps fumosorosea (strain ARSEF 2679) TaxID=1081104 RepID=A0A167ZLD6_CORFA|nr:hypothetical protein ISF_03830 [Cordyceps fumosorosea ARSEF 2679]OAA67654.1 hypothetical protein ISF_03830 [Cordyceps fumosorosea ARSEF 2679]